MYTARAFAKLVGVTVKTLQRWDRTKRLVAKRTSTNRRYYDENDLASVLKTPKAEGATVIYCRVSSQAQKPDLKNQRKILEQYAAARGIVSPEFVEEIGGGMDFTRPKFLDILSRIQKRQIACLVVAHKDRLCRFGFELVESVCRENDCELQVLNQERLSPEQEILQDWRIIVRCLSERLPILGGFTTSLKKALADKEVKA